MSKTVFFITLILASVAGIADAALHDRASQRVNDALDVNWNPDGSYTLASSDNFKGQAGTNDQLVWNHLISSMHAPLSSLRPVSTITSVAPNPTGDTDAADNTDFDHFPSGPLGFCDEKKVTNCVDSNAVASTYVHGSAAENNLLLIGMANENVNANSSDEWMPWMFLDPTVLQTPALNEPAINDPFAPFDRESTVVPVPPALWLFASALLGLGGMNSRRFNPI